jgi:hypothetical protein
LSSLDTWPSQIHPRSVLDPTKSSTTTTFKSLLVVVVVPIDGYISVGGSVMLWRGGRGDNGCSGVDGGVMVFGLPSSSSSLESLVLGPWAILWCSCISPLLRCLVGPSSRPAFDVSNVSGKEDNFWGFGSWLRWVWAIGWSFDHALAIVAITAIGLGSCGSFGLTLSLESNPIF